MLKVAGAGLPDLDPKLLLLYSELTLKENINTTPLSTKSSAFSHDLNQEISAVGFHFELKSGKIHISNIKVSIPE